MKRLLGVLMIAFGILLGIETIKGIVKLILMTGIIDKGSAVELGYAVGNLIANLAFCVAIFFLTKYGIRFIKSTQAAKTEQ